MTILLRLIFLIVPMIVLALAVTLILGIPIKIVGRNLDSIMFITVITTLWGFYQAFMNKNSPHRLAVAYLDFLEVQGITTKRPSILRLILRAAWHKFNVVRDPRFKLMEELGVKAFSVHEIQDTFVSARNLTLVSIAVFAPPESGLRADACKEAARDNSAVRLVFAYLDLSWDSAKVTEEGTREFKLVELPRLAPDRLELRSKADEQGKRRRFELEIEQIKSILSQGSWPRSLAEILQAIYDTRSLSRNAVDLVEFLKTHKWVITALQRLFKSLPAAAIERYLASRQFNAYLLSFAAGPGAKIAAPLAVLADPTKWEGKPYLFERYTPNTRIGLVPRGKKLDEFAAQLEADFPKAIAVAGTVPPKGGEIILHRMGLSGRDYYRVKLPEVEQRKAIAKLRELLARGIEPPDIISVLEHSEKPDELLAKIIGSPLQDLAGPLDSPEKANLERASDAIRAALRAALNVTSETELAERLERDGVLLRQVEAGTQAVSAVLALQAHPWTEDRIRVIVKSYLDTLRDLVAFVGLPPAAGKAVTEN
jgi:hypothetical protein